MKKLLYGFATVIAASGAGVSIVATRHQETIRPNVFVGDIPVGGLTPEEAAKKVRVWWESEKIKPLKLNTSKLSKTLPAFKPTEMGVTLDDEGTVAALPLQGFMQNAEASVTREEFPDETFEPIFKSTGLPPVALAKALRAAIGEPTPARVVYKGGQFIRKFETTLLELDKSALSEAVIEALKGEGVVELPLKESPKTVPDEQLSEINEVAAEFTTRFSAGNRPRSSNIKLASSHIDGLVLAPGEKFSFNGTVGQRTIKRGFKEAGVYINGRHDTGVGGGICQVSTTLYNAALIADMKIVRRSNHSLPVPYVPVGRDATVNYGAQDLVIENNFEVPIALSAIYEPGRLTFRILGKKQVGMAVKIERTGLKSWQPAVKTVVDKSLAPGKKKVVEKGSTGFSVNTYRLVYQDGKLVRRDPLGRSHYPGGSTIVAVGPAAAPVVAPTAPTIPPVIPGQG